MTSSAVLDEGRQVCEFAPGVRSLSERSARVAQKLEALGEMAGGIAHDFRNILTVIEAGLRLAERSAAEPKRFRVGIAAAREGLDRAAKLTSQLLVFARQEEPGVQVGDANELLRHLSLFLRQAAGPGIRIVFNFASDIPKCIVDRSQFGTALLNLVVNARDAMPRGGEIEIGTERCTLERAWPGSPLPGTYVRVRVKDGGLGMSAEVMRKVFDPFFTTKGDKGTGLGLPQVNAFMRRVGGHVEVASKPGAGTVVDLFLPSAGAEGVAPLQRKDDRRSPPEAVSSTEVVVSKKRTTEEQAKRKLDAELDRELEGTFPASDPLKLTRRKPEEPVASNRPKAKPATAAATRSRPGSGSCG